MLVHRRERRQLHRVRDFLEARRVAVLVQEPNQVIQHFFLPFRQCHGSPSYTIAAFATVGEPKAKVNGTLGQVAIQFDLTGDADNATD